MRLIAVLTVLCLAGPVHAQVRNSPQSQSPTEQALASKLMFEINEALQCNASTIVLQRSLAAAQGRVKELEARLESPPKAPALEEPAK